MAASIEIVRWSIPHAREAIGISSGSGLADPYEHERRVLRALTDAPDTIRKPAIHAAARRGGGSKWSSVDTGRVISSLIALGYLAGPIKRKKGKGRPILMYRINPAWKRADFDR